MNADHAESHLQFMARALLLAAALVISATAGAQGFLEEIVVTAQKRSENLQDVPMSISAFRPRRWRGALLLHEATVRLEVLEHDKRPVSAVADYTEVRDVASVEVAVDHATAIQFLFDPEHNLTERILSEQFTP